jgi:predicted DNA-binding transcriptional regulator AlpA
LITKSNLLSVPEFLQYVGISRSLLSTIQRSGKGPRETRLGKRLFIAKDAADEWIKSMETAPTPAQQPEGEASQAA